MRADRHTQVFAVRDPDGQFVKQDGRGRTPSLSEAGTWISRQTTLDSIKPDRVGECYYVPPGQSLEGWVVYQVNQAVIREAYPTS